MYFFSIVDDNQEDLTRILNVLKNECKYNAIDYQCDCYNSPLDFKFDKQYDAIFLDIDMPKENGIKFAQRINNSYNTKIIFITNHNHFIYASMDAHPFHFICKDKLEFEGIRILKHLFTVLNNEQEYLEVYINNTKKQVRILEIFYISVDDHLCMVHLNPDKQFIQINGPLISLYQKLKPKGFSQINRSTIINLKHIREITGKEVILKNNLSLQLKTRYQKDFQEDYKSYLLGIQYDNV